MNLPSSNYFKSPLQWMEGSWVKVEAKRNKKDFQSLIMKVQSKEGLAKSYHNLKTISYL